MIKIDVAIFAHNEAAGIGAFLQDLAQQDLFAQSEFDTQVMLLANGCTDATVETAQAALAGLPDLPGSVLELPLPGKSRTWERFIHELSRRDTEIFLFLDADISLPEPDTLTRLLGMLIARPALAVAVSRPVKDIEISPENLNLTERLIRSATGGLDDWRTAICGQLYAARAASMRQIHMPAGLPTEDGFLRAMLLTGCFEQDEDLGLIDGTPDIFHVYPSERTIAGLVRHQVRLVVGGAINFAVFRHLEAQPPGSRKQALEALSTDPEGLSGIVAKQLPEWPSGWIPLHFLVKRASAILSARRWYLKPRKLLMLVLGGGFDLVVYILAQLRMARGGVGFW